MSQEFLQAEWITAIDQVANRKGVTQNVRTDAPPINPNPFFEASKQQCDAVFRDGKTGFGKEKMILTRAAPLGKFFLIGSVMIQVIQQMPLAVLTKSDTPLFGAFAPNRQHPLLAIDMLQAQTTQF